jgi:hypothetical protein
MAGTLRGASCHERLDAQKGEAMADKPTVGQVINGHTVVAIGSDEYDPDDLVPVMLLRNGAHAYGDSAYVVGRYSVDQGWYFGEHATGYRRGWQLFCERINAPVIDQ